MSDYLRGVVTRVLAPSRQLQPRVATPFESPAPRSVEAHVATSEPITPSVSSSRRTTAVPRREIRGSSGTHDVAPASVHTEDASTDRAVGSRPIVSTHEPEAMREASTSVGRDPFEDPGALQIASPTIASPTLASSMAAARAERPIARPTHRDDGVPAEPPTERTAAASTAASSDPAVARPFAPRARIASIPSVGRLPVTRRRDRAHEESRVSTAPAPIEITIGRIDVRAVVANTPPPAKARAKAPMMSLDDYLATRGGGQ